ncbi:MAG TPA: histidine kinase, partial [Polyangiaceae bacterium]|nr:histidine kinase [Polyangiaceae bacterium]
MKSLSTRGRGVLIVLLIWTSFGLLFSGQAYLGQNYLGRELSVHDALVRWMVCAYAWALLTPLVVWLNRRFPIDRRRWLAALLVHGVASIVFSVAGMGLFLLGEQALQSDRQLLTRSAFVNLFVAGLHIDLLIYATLVGVCYAIEHYQRYRERELTAVQLQAALAEAELAALKAQLHPHFLFNTLNTVAILMQEDPAAARKMLVSLSDLLRMILKKGRAHEVSLREEVQMLESYLEIERTRFHDRLHVSLNVDESALDARVPELVLQPLVENAIKHGVLPRRSGGRVEINVQKQGSELELEVRDDGPGLSAEAATRGTGVGLSNTRVRLAKLYAGRHRFELKNGDAGGLRVLV